MRDMVGMGFEHSIISVMRRPLALLGALMLLAASPTAAEMPAPRTVQHDIARDAGHRLMRAYPDHIVAVEGNAIVWRDGTRTQIDDRSAPKTPSELLTAPDLKDVFAYDYPRSDPAAVPAPDADPGRIRPSSLFDKMYGNCRSGDVLPHLVDVAWLPGRSRQRLKVTRINGVAEKLRAVSEELTALPPEFDVYLTPAAGTYACRPIAGTDRGSAHGYGIAIDIAVKRADYWRWPVRSESAGITYRNRIPMEIVRVFEKHGFIWGGRWHHFDTMHFEYRPELLLE